MPLDISSRSESVRANRASGVAVQDESHRAGPPESKSTMTAYQKPARLLSATLPAANDPISCSQPELLYGVSLRMSADRLRNLPPRHLKSEIKRISSLCISKREPAWGGLSKVPLSDYPTRGKLP
jgi:hypothetical protein